MGMNIARKKLSYEKFAELANRMTDLNGDWIYLLEQTELEEESNHYPQFELGITIRIFFRTFADAEKIYQRKL